MDSRHVRRDLQRHPRPGRHLPMPAPKGRMGYNRQGEVYQDQPVLDDTGRHERADGFYPLVRAAADVVGPADIQGYAVAAYRYILCGGLVSGLFLLSHSH